MSGIGVIIRNYRKKSGLTAAELAKNIGRTQGTISHIETGKRNPSEELLIKLKETLQIPQQILDEVRAKNQFNSNNVKTDGLMTSKNLGINIALGATNFSLHLISSIDENFNFDQITKTDKESICGEYGLERQIVFNTISNFLRNNENSLKEEIKKDMTVIIDEMENEYSKMKLEFK